MGLLANASRNQKKKKRTVRNMALHKNQRTIVPSHVRLFSAAPCQLPTSSYQSATTNQQLPISHYQPATTNQQLPISNYQPATTKQLPTSNYQPATTNQLLPTSNYQSATTNQQCTLSCISSSFTSTSFSAYQHNINTTSQHQHTINTPTQHQHNINTTSTQHQHNINTPSTRHQWPRVWYKLHLFSHRLPVNQHLFLKNARLL